MPGIIAKPKRQIQRAGEKKWKQVDEVKFKKYRKLWCEADVLVRCKRSVWRRWEDGRMLCRSHWRKFHKARKLRWEKEGRRGRGGRERVTGK